MPEMITQDYAFMHTVAQLLANTDHRITVPDADIKFFNDYSFDLYVKHLNDKSDKYVQKGRQKRIDFNQESSYALRITYRVQTYASDGSDECVFFVDNQKFTTSTYLADYFVGCKREKVLHKFLFPGMLPDGMWFFEIKNGQVVNAFYYYDPSNEDYMNDLVYDLINKSFIRYGEWEMQYPYL